MKSVIASKIKTTFEQEQVQGLAFSCEQQEERQEAMEVTD